MKKDPGHSAKSFYLHNINTSEVYILSSEHIFGRDDDSNIVLTDENISLQHFKVCVRDNDAYIQDLDSSNGTYINCLKITPWTEERLREGDSITAGKLILQISKKEKSLGLQRDLSLVSLNYNFDISSFEEEEKRLIGQIKKLEFREARKIHVETQLDSFSEDLDDFNIERLKELEIYHKENKNKYDLIIKEIPKVAAKLKLLKLTAKNMQVLLEERGSLKSLELKQSKYSLELKDIKRANNSIKIKKLKEELRDLREKMKDAS